MMTDNRLAELAMEWNGIKEKNLEIARLRGFTGDFIKLPTVYMGVYAPSYTYSYPNGQPVERFTTDLNCASMLERELSKEGKDEFEKYICTLYWVIESHGTHERLKWADLKEDDFCIKQTIFAGAYKRCFAWWLTKKQCG